MALFFIHWLTTALALGVTAWVVPGIHVTSGAALLVAALVLGFVNAIVRPILIVLTFPVTLLTLGLFYFVVNGAVFALAAALVPGFDIDGFGGAILGALVVGFVSWFIGLFTRGPRRD